jgi:hypothetical protein
MRLRGWRIFHEKKPVPRRSRRIKYFPQDFRAPRIISKSQKFCRHKEAAKEAAEKKIAISTIDKIA